MTFRNCIPYFFSAVGFLPVISCTERTQPDNQLVRIAEIEIDSTYIDRYNEFLREEIEASVRLEPGVLTLYGVAEKKNQTRVTLFETYADSVQYRSHLETPHFQNYKQGTLHMVKNLDLIPAQRILYHNKPKLAQSNVDSLFIRLVSIELYPDEVNEFTNLGTTVMLPGISEELGVLVMYAVARRDDLTKVSILEVYENKTAYDTHLATPHYNQYQDLAKTVVKTITFTEVKPVLLGFSR